MITHKNSTSETPFLLTYDIKVMIPVEIGCPSHRVLHFSINNSDKELRKNLDLIEEVWISVLVKNKACQYRATRYYNARVRNKRLKMEDMVLRKLKATNKSKERGKLVLKWDDLFKVVRFFKINIYHLQCRTLARARRHGDPSWSGELISGSLFCEKGSHHLVLWSLESLTNLLEILRQGTGCIKKRF